MSVYQRIVHRRSTDPVVDDRADAVDVRETRRVGVADFIANLVYIAATVLETVLLIRFLLSLGGANPANAFANFIYNLSRPFVSPFRGLFSIHTVVGVGSRFEYEVLVAMVVYALLAGLIIMLIRSVQRPLE